MRPPPSKNVCSGISGSIYDLNLPEVRPGEEPRSCPQPSFELTLSHARFLIKSGLAHPSIPDRKPNPEPFVLD